MKQRAVVVSSEQATTGEVVVPPQKQFTKDEREQLILRHMSQVRFIAWRIHSKLADAANLDDLVSSGVVGLIAAVDSFDPSFNCGMKSYAQHRIRGAILDSLRGLDLGDSQSRKRMQKVEQAKEQIQKRYLRQAAEEEVAAELELTLEEYRSWLSESQYLISMDEEPLVDSRRSLSLEACSLLKPGESYFSTQLEAGELYGVLQDGLRLLSEPYRTVLAMWCAGEELKEIGGVLGVHLSRACQLKQEAISRLTNYVRNRWGSVR